MSLAVFGDVHGRVSSLDGQLNDIFENMHIAPWDEPRYALMAGDVGLSYDTWFGAELRQYMNFNEDVTWLVMRGNHDDRYWKKNADDVKGHYRMERVLGCNVLCDSRYPNIKYLPDRPATLDYEGRCILCLPGAFSVDGRYRLDTGRAFVEDEQLTEDELALGLKLAQDNKVDLVVSHTAPLRYKERFSDLLMSFIDQSMVDETMERAFNGIEDVVAEGNPDYKWCFGHFHDDREIVDNHVWMLYRKPLVVFP